MITDLDANMITLPGISDNPCPSSKVKGEIFEKNSQY
jgi:hypothetical protein